MLEVVLSSSRRVKKGPGRRPQSAKRQRFVELRERGWSILAAARQVGVSRTTGNNWSRGYKIYRHGQVAGFVSALERLAVRQISPRFLSQDERIEIADLRHAGLSIRQIAHRLRRAPSTFTSLSFARISNRNVGSIVVGSGRASPRLGRSEGRNSVVARSDPREGRSAVSRSGGTLKLPPGAAPGLALCAISDPVLSVELIM